VLTEIGCKSGSEIAAKPVDDVKMGCELVPNQERGIYSAGPAATTNSGQAIRKETKRTTRFGLFPLLWNVVRSGGLKPALLPNQERGIYSAGPAATAVSGQAIPKGDETNHPLWSFFLSSGNVVRSGGLKPALLPN
jgi:hypothetical protein